MSAFCVFGVSKNSCRLAAEKKISMFTLVNHEAVSITVDEWRVQRDELAAQLFEESVKPVRISPEFDAPQFCRDWMAVAPSEIKLAKIMVWGPKFDGGGRACNAQGQASHYLGRISANQSSAVLALKSVQLREPSWH